MSRSLERREMAVIGALGFIAAITVAWWALALWPVPGEIPPWLARTREACFGTTPDGLPSPAGWLLLIGEPVAMSLALFIIAGHRLTAALRQLVRIPSGRAVLASAGLLLVAGSAAATARIGYLRSARDPAAYGGLMDNPARERLDQMAPPLVLVSSGGDTTSLEQFRGRVVLVAFVYGHCETVCPTVVDQVVKAQRRLAPGAPAVLLVTLDPWRDTPARLGPIASRWRLPADALLLGGSVPDVERALDQWGVLRSRDALTGDITHATPVYVVNPHGRMAYRVGPYAGAIEAAVRSLSG